MQHYVIKFVGGFLPELRFPPLIKLPQYELVLKVALLTITL